MNSLVKNMFKIVGICVASLLLWTIVFGVTGRSIMWKAVKAGTQAAWKSYSFNDGKGLSDAYSSVYTDAVDISTN